MLTAARHSTRYSRMKFSLIFEAQLVDTGRESEYQVFHQSVAQAVRAEAAGFDRIWAVEHTSLTQYAHMSAPETFLAYVAGKTERLRIGHGVVCLPIAQNHPIKVAERIATLDILSEGRVDFGIGKGGTMQEAGAFGNQLEDLQAQVDEAMYAIPKMWRDGLFEHQGKHFSVPPRPIHPKPRQQPHPPLYLACTREETLNMAGERGLGALVLGFGGPDDIAAKNVIYRAACQRRTDESQVGEFATEHLAALCPAIVLDDAEQARRVGLRGQRFFAESIGHWYNDGPAPSSEELSVDELTAIMEAGREQVVAWQRAEGMPIGTESTGMYNPNHAYGSPEDAIAYVERLQSAGADEIMFLSQMGTVPHAVIMETIDNIGRHVIPHFLGAGMGRRASGAGGAGRT